MPLPTLTKLGPEPTFQDIVDKLNKTIAELQHLMVNLDTLNVSTLNADVIEAGTIDATKLAVTQLSAIAADLGTVTAGILQGAIVRTNSPGNYPNVELSSTLQLFRASKSSNQSVSVEPAGYSGNPAVVHRFGSAQGTEALTASSFQKISSAGIDISLVSGKDIVLAPDPFGGGRVATNFYQILDQASSQTLQTVLNNLNSQISTLNGQVSTLNSNVSSLSSAISGKVSVGSSTSTDGAHNHGIPSGTQLAVAGGGFVTFVTSGSHSHTV